MTPDRDKLLAAASAFSAATMDLVEEAREADHKRFRFGNVGCGETLRSALDGVFLLMSQTPSASEDADLMTLRAMIGAYLDGADEAEQPLTHAEPQP